MIVLVDTREQLPYWTPSTNEVKCAKAVLTVGDYTTLELLGEFHIERKSPQDFYGTIIRDHVRFRKEIFRAIEQDIEMVVIVECSRSDFVNKRFHRGAERKIKPETLNKVCRTIQERYNLTIIWCKHGREHAKKKTLSMLKHRERKKINKRLDK